MYNLIFSVFILSFVLRGFAVNDPHSSKTTKSLKDLCVLEVNSELEQLGKPDLYGPKTSNKSCFHWSFILLSNTVIATPLSR
jgi:hypothetical protein